MNKKKHIELNQQLKYMVSEVHQKLFVKVKNFKEFL